MAEWIIAPVMEKIIDACFEYLKDQVNWQTGMEEELQRLRDIQPKIQAVISVYSKVEIKDPALNKWYWQLRDAVDEADDVLDDFDYMKLEKQVSKTKKIRKVRSIMKFLKKRLVKIGKRALRIDPNLKRLKAAVQKLVKVSADVNDFHNILEGAKQKQEQEQLELLQTRETGSMPANVLLGRSNDMEFVKEWLRNPYQTGIANNDLYKNISLLSVVGLGGMGKTTLLQHVYEDIIMTKEFDVQMWVCVSHNFDAKTVTKNILESLQNEKTNLDSLDQLQRSLQSKVSFKRFLLVLDDIWEDNETKWENMLSPLRYGNLGSKILITTRMDSVAFNIPMIKNKKTFQLKGLKENDCLELFNTHAFGVDTPSESLKYIVAEIVKKLSGSPLAAKMIGSTLKSCEDASYWRKFLDTNISDLEQGPNGLFPILKLSYTNLSKCLQICFAFCCIFPQDYHFDRDDLVRMWIALGFIQSSNNSGETLEDIGRRYFDILVQKSFFDEFNHTYDDDGVYYKMHDLLYDLAHSVSKQECFRVVADKELPIPETIRHLSIDTHSLEAIKKIGKFKNLRSLFLFHDANYDESILSKIFEASKSLRLLYIYARQQKGIFGMIDNLTHLRYFNFTSEVVQFPRSISQLYHLQFLIYNHNCSNISSSYGDDLLLNDINNLYNLRYLRLPRDEDYMIYGIGKLKSLQELKRFTVKNEIGYDIGELEHLNELRQISIYQLENIKDVEQACSAKFLNKKNLTDLSLQWGNDMDCRIGIIDKDLDEKVLNSIQPYKNYLKRLLITAYMGIRSANWISNVDLISNLEYIKLEKCWNWQTLPSFGQLPFLKSLYLLNMSKVEHIDHNKDCIFPKLEVLHIENLKVLQDWFDTTIAENKCLLPYLSELCLLNCPKLQELPSLPTELQQLKMNNIGWKGCNWLSSIRNCSSIEIRNASNLISCRGRQKLKKNGNRVFRFNELSINDPSMLLMEPLRSISSLGFLKIEKNDDFVSFPNEIEHWFLQQSSSLLYLEFHELQSLQYLPYSLKSLYSLKILRISNVLRLKLLPNPPVSLRELQLCNLESLQCLSSTLSTNYFLISLTLRNIPLLKSLPDLPPFLMDLNLEKLENLDCLPTLPTLNSLSIIEVPRLLEFPELPTSLKILTLESLQCLSSSLSTISSLTSLTLRNIPPLKSLPDLPSSLKVLALEELESLQCLTFSLPTISSLTSLTLRNIPLLKSLPDILPSSLNYLTLESLQCLPSSLSTNSSLISLTLRNIPLLKSLPDLPSSQKFLTLDSLQCLPSSLSTNSSLKSLTLRSIPLLKSLPDTLSSLNVLVLEELESLQYLPSSLSTSSSLTFLKLKNIPLLKSLPDLPSSLMDLNLEKLENLDCLPSCLPTLGHIPLPTLRTLSIIEVPRLLELPAPYASLKVLSIQNCHAQLMERYPYLDIRR